MVTSRRLEPGEMYPAGETQVRSRLVELKSGLQVRVVEAGSDDAPPIILIPGWACSAWVFHETLAPLAAAGFHAIAVDLKGHGLSDKPHDPAEYRLHSMRDHVLGIMDALGLPRASLVGHSMGGAIACQVAALSPDRITALAMVAPVGFTGVRGMMLFKALTPQFAIPLLSRLATRTLVRVMLNVVYGSLRRPTSRDVSEFWAPAQFADFTRAMRHMLHEFTWDTPFPKLEVPWMTIVGSRDVLSPVGDAGRYKGTDGKAPVIVIEGAGHVIFDEAPEVVNPALIDFFGRNSRSGYISTQNE